MSWLSRLFGGPPPPTLQPTCLIVGLGNPGPDYDGTRHNAGFETIDHLAARLGVAMDQEAGFAFVAEAEVPGEESESAHPGTGSAHPATEAGDPSPQSPTPGTRPVVALARPLTFMNRSGKAVAALLDRYALGVDDLLVVYDDIALPIGALRLRGKGSHGGHNGIRDIIEVLGSTEFPRLRVGVGNSFPPGGQVHFVLSPFDDDERSAADAAFQEAAEAALTFAREGLTTAMNRHNRR